MALPPPQQRPEFSSPSNAQHSSHRWSSPASGHAATCRPATDGQLQLLRALQAQTENSTTRLAKVESVVGLWQRTFEDLVKAAATYCDEAAGPADAMPMPSRSTSADSIINTAATICTDSLRLVRQPSDELLHAARATTPETDGSAAATAGVAPPDMFRQPHLLEKLRQRRSPKPGDFREIRVDVVGTPTFSFEQQRTQRTSHTDLAEALSVASEDITQEVERRIRSKMQAEFLDYRSLHMSERVPSLHETGQLEAAGWHLVSRMDDISQLIVEVKHEQHAQSMELISLKARLDVLGFDQLPSTKQVQEPPDALDAGVDPASARFRVEVLKAAAALESRNQTSAATTAQSATTVPQPGKGLVLQEKDASTACSMNSAEATVLFSRIERLEGFCVGLQSSASAASNGEAAELTARCEATDARLEATEARLEAIETAHRVVSTGSLVTHGEVMDLKTRLEVLEKAQHATAVSTHAAIGSSGDVADSADFDKLRMALARTVRHVASLGDDLGAIRAEHAELIRRIDVLGEATAGEAAHSIQRLENALSEELAAKRMQLDKAMSIQGQHR